MITPDMTKRFDIDQAISDSIEYLTLAGLPARRLIEARAAVVTLLYDMERIHRRAVAHPDDTDEDRERDLLHIEAISRIALTNLAQQT